MAASVYGAPSESGITTMRATVDAGVAQPASSPEPLAPPGAATGPADSLAHEIAREGIAKPVATQPPPGQGTHNPTPESKPLTADTQVSQPLAEADWAAARWDEPVIEGPRDLYASWGVGSKTLEQPGVTAFFEGVGNAAKDLGGGITTMQPLVAMVRAAPMSTPDLPARQAAAASCETALKAEWGENFQANVDVAKAVYAHFVARAPALDHLLRNKGLDNNPGFVKALVRFALKRMPG